MARQPVMRTRPLAEAMEDRILHSADLSPLLLVPIAGGEAVQHESVLSEPAAATQQFQEIVFVDSGLSGVDQLLLDLQTQRNAGRPVDIVLIDADQDGIALITSTLAGRGDITAVHLLAHGSDGLLQLGNVRLDESSLQQRAGEIADWSNALTAEADLLLYGCEVAQTAAGEAFVRDLAMLTGADVAASSDLTGAAALGGDWVLEYSSGQIEVASAISQQLQDEWIASLAIASLQAAQDSYIKLMAPDDLNNFGVSTQLIVDRETNDLQRALLQFDLSPIPAGATINSASLQMQATAVGGALNINVYELLQSWSEGAGNGTAGAVNWNQRITSTSWTTAGGTFNSTPVATLNTNAAGLHSWDVTTLVQGWINGSKVNNGVMVASPDGGGNRTATYSSREGATAPVLVVDYTSPVNTAPTFGTGVGDGKVATVIGAGDDEAQAVTIQPDGKLLVAGRSHNGTNFDFTLTRYNADGTLDPSFDGDGKVTTNILARDDYGMSVVVQPDGKILLGGSSVLAGNADFAVVRYNADGSLDSGFGSGGMVTTPIGAANDWGQKLTLQADGKILLAGYGVGAANDDVALVRYNANGTLDGSFGTGGKVITTVGTGVDRAYSVAVQSDAKIVVGGSSFAGAIEQFALLRYNSNGTLDGSFGTGGKVTTGIGTVGDRVYTVLLQSDGKIVATGGSHNGSNIDFAAARYNADGTLDTSFGTGGKVTTAIGSGNDWGYSATLQADGKILVAGSAVVGGADDFALLRYNANGTLDGSFGSAGKVTTAIGAGADVGREVVVQADGKIVVAGHTSNGSNLDLAVVRYNANGTLDTSFDRVSTLDGTPAFTEGGAAVVLDGNVQIQDSELVAAGNYSGATLTLARNGGSQANDVFSATGTLGALIQGGALVLGGVTIGTVTSNSGGTLQLTFNSNAIQARVNSALQQIAYSNSSVTPPASAQIDWTFSDGNTGAQGSGGAQTAVGSTTVATTAVNDAPMRTAGSVNDLTIAEDAAPTSLGLGSLAYGPGGGSDESAQTLTYTVTAVPAAALGHITLADGTTVVTASTSYSLAQLRGTMFKAAADANGGPASFSWNVVDNGGTANGGVDTLAESLTVTVAPVNDAPTLGNGTLAAINEDTTSPAGQSVSAIFAGQFADPDAGASLGGIAIVGNGANAVTQGAWQYSSTGGADWFAIGTVADDASALAIGSGSLIRFVPVADYNGTPPALVVRGLDNSYGGGFSTTAGSQTRVTVDSSVNGGATSIAATTADLATTVNVVNDAPVASGSATLATINEDSAAPAGATVSSLFGANFSDSADQVAGGSSAETFAGIAISSYTVDAARGQWQYSTDSGGNWTTLGSATTATAITLDAATGSMLRFVPTADYNGAATALSVNLIESGGTVTNGASVNLTGVTGGTTRYSSATVALNHTIIAVNDAPVVSTSGGALAYIENAAATAIDGGLTVADLDNTNLTGATVSISANFAGGQDVLAFTNQLGITGSWNAGTGVLTLSGSTTVANYQTALRTVTYFNSSDNPSTLARTASFVVNDGAAPSIAVTRNVTVTAVNDVPVVTTSGSALAYTENQAATAIDAALTVTDLDNTNLTGATISISTNYASGQDVLAFTNQLGITGSWNAGVGVLTLSGTTTVANYQTALRNVTYFNSSDDPSTLARTASFVVNDGALPSSAATRTINVTAVNDAPVVTASGGALAYAENTAAMAIDTGLTITDIDGATLNEATVSISANYASGQDVLAFTNQLGITGSWNAGTGVLTLSGTTTLANYETALRSVSYFNSSDNPSTLARTVSFTVNDGALPSSAATKTINVTSVNDAPVANDDVASTSPGMPIDVNVKANDSDADNPVASLIVTIIGNSAGTTATVNGDNSIRFDPGLTTGVQTVTYRLSDGSLNSNIATLTINVAVNMPPASADASATFDEDTNYVFQLSDFAFTDADLGQTLSGVRIDTLPGNGTLTLNGLALAATDIVSVADISANRFVFTPAPDGNGLAYASFSFSVQDDFGGLDLTPNVFTLNVTPVNDAPTNTPVTLTAIAEDSGPRLITQAELLANATDVDGPSLSATNLIIASGLGSLVGNGDGTWTYTPALDDDTAVSFSYTVSDGSLSAAGMATLDITPVNDAPTTSEVTLAPIVEDSGARLITQAELLANAADVDGPSLSATGLAIGSGSGSLVDNGDGTWTFTPALNDDSSVTLSYAVTDGSLSAVGSASLDITPDNDAPTTTPVTLAAITEDSGARLITQAELLANAADVDGPGLTATGLTISSGAGSLIDNGDGTWTYTPALNDDGSVSFNYTVTDGSLSAVGSASLDITPVNDAPTTSPVTLAAIAEDGGPRLIAQAELLANAADVDGPSLTATGLVISTGSGSLVDNGDGSWTYTPALDDDSSVVFSYTVTDGSLSAAGSATLDITPVNDAPISSSVTLAPIAEDSGARLITQGELLANSADIDGPILTATGLAISSGAGSLIDNGDGTWTFTPALNDDTSVSFSYIVTDGSLTAAGSATLDITPVNDAPTTLPVTLTAIAEDSGPRLITQAELLANSADIDGPILTATGLTISSGAGSLVDNGDGTWTYTPAPNDDSSVTFGYSVTDGSMSVFGSATLNITPANDAPTTSPVTLAAIAEDSGTRLITQAELLANATDVDGPSLTALNLAISSGSGSLVDNGDSTWTYTPALNDDTSVSFSYIVTDGSLTAAGSATLDITPVNDAPTTNAVTLTAIAEDSGGRLITQAELLANAADIDGPLLTATGLTISSGSGSLLGNGDGSWTYTPALNDDNAVSFSYTVTDGNLSVAGSATLDITPVNDAPTTSPVTLAPIAEDSGGRLITQAELLANAVDVDGPALSATALTISSGSGYLLDNGDGTWTYTPAPDDDTAASFNYTITDGSLNVVGTASLDITPVNDAPTTSPVTLTAIAEDSGPRLITQAELLANTADVDGPSPLAIGLAISSGSGSLIDNGDGSWTYTAAIDDDGSVSFSYTVTDGSLGVVGNASLDITPVNDAPTASLVTLAAIVEDSGPRLITQAELLANASDVDGPGLTATGLAISSGLGALVDNGVGTWTFTPALNDDTSVSFSYTVTDGSLSAAGSAMLDITPVNDAPTTSPVTLAAITEDSGARLITQAELLVNAADVDGPSLTATGLVISSGFGSLVNNGDGTWTYTPALNDDSSVTLSYSVTDGSLSAAASATLDITPFNNAPVIAASPGALAYTENQAATAIDTGLSISDLDDLTLVSATVSITGNFSAGQDILGFADQNGITGSWNAATGVLTLSGSATLAQYEAALQSVTYFNGSDDPSALARTVSFVVNDGMADSNVASRNILATAVNDAPVISISGSTLAYTENQIATAIDAGLTLSDVDSPALTSATVSISVNYASGQDILGFTDQLGITGTWDAGTGVLTLSGVANVADYHSALRSVTYFNSSDDPIALLRTVSIIVNDGLDDSNVGTRDIAITPVNDAPTTSAVVLAPVAEDSGARLITQGELLVNASDVDGPSLSASGLAIISGAGSLVDNGDGTWTYTTSLNDDTAVTFSYTVTDGSLSAAGSASLDITPVNDAPTTSPVTLAAIAEDSGPRLITQAELLTNAADVDGPSITATGLTISTGAGSLVDNGDGTWTYTPASNDDSSVVFSYTVTDGSLSATGSATLDISPVNGAPTTSAVTLTAIAEDSGARLITQAELLANAADVDGPALTATGLVISTGSGSLIDNGDGTWTYTPALNDDSSVAFNYTVTDGSLSVVGSAALDITSVNDAPTTSPVTLAPIAVDSAARLITQAELLANAADVDGPSLIAISLAISSGAGSLIDNGDGTWTYTAAFDDDGSVSFSYTVTDGSLGVVGNASLDITPVNDAPTTSAVTLTAITEDSGPRLVTQAELLANASDADGPTLTAINLAVSSGAGALVGNGDGTWSYTPALNDDSAVIFSYTITDGSLSVAGSAMLEITPVNDAPTTSTVILAPIAEDSGARLITQADLLVNAADIEGPSLTATGLVISSGFGSLVDNGDGTWTYTPALDDDTSVSFSYIVTDGSLTAAASATMDITPFNNAPVIAASPGALAYTENQAATAIDTDLTVSDIDNTNLTGATVSISTNYASGQDVLTFTNQLGITGSWNAGTGVLTLSGDATVANYETALRTVTYFNSSDDPSTLARTVSFVVDDGSASSVRAFKSVSVAAVNNAPATTLVVLPAIEEDSGPHLITQAALLANASDIDGPSLTATGLVIESGSGRLIDNGDGSWTYTTAPDDDTSVRFSYSVTDGIAAAAGSATLNIRPVNDAPISAEPIADQRAATAVAMQFQLPAATFADRDGGDTLRYAATLADGSPLPEWLSFDVRTRTFAGTPSVADAGGMLLRVTAIDGVGATAQTYFAIIVSAAVQTSSTALQTAVEPSLEAPMSVRDVDPSRASDLMPTGPLPDAPPTAAAVPRVIPVTYLPEATATTTYSTIELAAGTRQTIHIEVVKGNAYAAEFSEISMAPLRHLLQSDEFRRKLDDLLSHTKWLSDERHALIAATFAGVSGLSVGYVVWLVRGGVLLSSMLSALPAWQMIDPVPVLAAAGKARRRRARAGTDTDHAGKVERLFDGRSAPAPNPGPSTEVAPDEALTLVGADR